MAKQILNTGVSNNDKSGDTLRAGGLKIKANFDEIYAALANDGLNISGGALLKSGSYTDLRNVPEFHPISTSGSFNDLEDKPELSTFVSVPNSLIGTEGNFIGQISADDNYVYLCTADYEQQLTYSSLSFVEEENFINYQIRAATSETDTTAITLKTSAGILPPSVDWLISDGTVERTITLVTEIGDGSGGVWYECTLDGTFTTVANQQYTIEFIPPAGNYVASFTWSGSYQPLVDAHALGTLTAKLFKSGDTIGRTITHAVYDSLNSRFHVSYSGTQFTGYTGMSVVIDQPEIWKQIPLNANANLGSFKIEGNTLGTYDDGNSWGGSSMNISPNGEGYTWIGIPNDSAATSGASLAIGNTSPTGGGIQLLTDGGNWTFRNDSDLELPTNGGIVFDRANTTIRVGMGFHIASGEGISIDAIDETDPDNLVYKNWYFGSNGNITFPDSTVQETAWAGGRVVSVPTHSTGTSGDLEGDLAFSNGYIYHCTADYGQVGHQVSVATAYNGATSLNTNSFQLTKSTDTLQIAIGDIISDSDGGATSVVVSVSSDANYTYVGTGVVAYSAVFPLTFTSTDYVSGGNIWKRVAWSNDTW